MCVVGGMGSYFGPILGGLIVAMVYNYLPGVTEYYQGFLGFFVLLVVYFMRDGLLSRSNPLFNRKKAQPAGKPATR